MHWKHILVTTDLSEESERAFLTVAELAKENNAEITLLNVVADLRVVPQSAPLAPPMTMMDIDQECKEAERRLAIQSKLFDKSLKVICRVIMGDDIPREIAKYAASNGQDLIAISTHGRSGFQRMIMGSVAEAVLHHSHVPVLCFPQSE